ncbi:MAG: Unknown protein [uncultured Sulfurovum sp.]|uniref:DUF433 domain-containing protein n=1 Tax=uncultured Sulfurovum sp. TaxID=269237 RepID=A0A6S6TY25_9BACT|nr:MAG: Unknown protein [uncultured Sulfurovum sp.]
MILKPLSFLNGQITIDADLCNGKPTIRGQRITVETVLEFLSAGESRENILKAYPSLTDKDITSCLIFATKMMNQKYSLQQIV